MRCPPALLRFKSLLPLRQLAQMTHVTGNVMQTLEDRTEKSRREMDLHDTIDTVRVLNARNQHVDIDKVKRQLLRCFVCC